MEAISHRESFASPYARANYLADINALITRLRGQDLDQFCDRLEKQGYSIMERFCTQAGDTELFAC